MVFPDKCIVFEIKKQLIANKNFIMRRLSPFSNKIPAIKPLATIIQRSFQVLHIVNIF